MDRPDTDVVVLGAGPAGIAAATCLLAQGLGVLVIDPALPPAPRTESLPTNGIALAQSLGLGQALAHAGCGRAAAMRLCWRGQPEVRDFAGDGPLLLDRVVLHDALCGLLPPGVLRRGRVSRLAETAGGVRLRLREASLSARLVIDARGRAGLREPGPAANPLAALTFSGLADAPAAAPSMLLQSLAEGWLWACLLPGGRLSGSVFLPAASLAGRDARGRAGLLARLLAGSDLGALRDLSAGPVAAAALQVAEDPFASPNVIRTGDAALARDPIASHGLVHALRSGAQAAAAAATLLDPQGEADAARSFIHERHRWAARSAAEATARAHAEQARHRTAFWEAAVMTPASPPASVPWPALSRPLALSPLSRAALLEGGRIRWEEALWLPRSGQAASRFGQVTAGRLAQLMAPPAPIAQLSARLAGEFGPGLAQGILQQLLDEGALVASPATGAAGQAAAASRA